MKPKFVELKDPNNSRTYFWQGGSSLTVKNVARIAVSERQTHRLETKSGDKYIIPPGWLYMKVDVKEWTF
jgi:hypothetical protein